MNISQGVSELMAGTGAGDTGYGPIHLCLDEYCSQKSRAKELFR